ncbi:MAG: hypothetical protein ABEK59_10290 [Halobacteria archaeon]
MEYGAGAENGFLERDGFFNVVSDVSLYGVTLSVAVCALLEKENRRYRYRSHGYREILKNQPESSFADGGNPVFLGLGKPECLKTGKGASKTGNGGNGYIGEELLTATLEGGMDLPSGLSDMEETDFLDAVIVGSRYPEITEPDGSNPVVDEVEGVAPAGSPVEVLSTSLHPYTRFSGDPEAARDFLDEIDVSTSGELGSDERKRFNTAVTLLAAENEGVTAETVGTLMSTRVSTGESGLDVEKIAHCIDAAMNSSPSRVFSGLLEAAISGEGIGGTISKGAICEEWPNQGYRDFQMEVAETVAAAENQGTIQASDEKNRAVVLERYISETGDGKVLECVANVLDTWITVEDGVVLNGRDGTTCISASGYDLKPASLGEVFGSTVYGGGSRYFVELEPPE